jgi:preprotein translocase subunit Sss1
MKKKRIRLLLIRKNKGKKISRHNKSMQECWKSKSRIVSMSSKPERRELKNS